MNVLVTGANGFIGKNLCAWLERCPDVRVLPFDQEHAPAVLEQHLAAADFVFHLAGVNRPQSEDEFRAGNVDLTARVCERLLALGRRVPLVLSSSVQAFLDNPYGISKRQAEEVVTRYAQASGVHCTIFRLKNVFGKWCRPNYNSVVATFCHNISRDLPISISNPDRELELVHVDDVVAAFLAEIGQQRSEARVQRSEVSHEEVAPSYKVTLGRLAELIRSFRDMRGTLQVPDLADEFTRKLYGTYLSYLEPGDFAYDLEKRCDPRGCLAEFVKSPGFGQLFVSRTEPGITRGNHYHHTKAEKFLVVEGEAVIRFREIREQRSAVSGQEPTDGAQPTAATGHRSGVIEYRVSGRDFRVVDIPPGYTHSIENVGDTELVTLFWACEVFDPGRSDTHFLAV